MSEERMQTRFLDCSGMDLQEAERWAHDLAFYQYNMYWWIGDLFRHVDARFQDYHYQAWPVGLSEGMMRRINGVIRAYPTKDDRRHEATWTQYMRIANKPDRHKRLEAIVDQGLTTDESRKADLTPNSKGRYLLCVDVNYFVHQYWHSGLGVESGMKVAEWIQRTVARMKDRHGLTDVACCFDSRASFRKKLTEEWDDKYKDRPDRDPELFQQVDLCKSLLAGQGFCTVFVDDMEADDVMASFASQFDGQVTLLVQDKDLRQCLSPKCNMLTSVDWEEDPTSGELIPKYNWVTRGDHINGCSYQSATVSGILPCQWPDFQALAGDSVDTIKGAPGIGAKGAAYLIQEFGSASAAIQAAESGDERIRLKQRDALLQFSDKLDVTLQLVTLRTDLPIPKNTMV